MASKPSGITGRPTGPGRGAFRGKLSSLNALVLGLLLLLLAGGCSSGASDCLSPGKIRSGDHECTIVSGGRERSFRVHVPRGYTGENPVPIVLVFHGGLGTGKYIQKQTGMTAVSDANDFVAVFPDGLWRTWNAGGCCEKAMRNDIDDVGFVSDMLDFLSAGLNIDERRIYATGFSNGAMLSHRLACELSERITAIAPVSGVIMVPPCHPASPVSVMVIHGSADPRSLWEGGLGDKDPRKGTRESIPRTMKRLQTRYQCAGEPSVTFLKGAVTCRTRESCQGDVDITLCRIEGGGHQWPGGEAVWPDRLGPANTDISASELIWEFFQQNVKPTASASDPG